MIRIIPGIHPSKPLFRLSAANRHKSGCIQQTGFECAWVEDGDKLSVEFPRHWARQIQYPNSTLPGFGAQCPSREAGECPDR